MVIQSMKFIGGSVQLTAAGVSLFFAVRGITTDLRRVRDLTEIKQVEKEDKMISEGTEDGSQVWIEV